MVGDCVFRVRNQRQGFLTINKIDYETERDYATCLAIRKR